MIDPPIHIHKTELMQRILDAVARGYHWYTFGQIPSLKVARLSDKFGTLYGTCRNSNQRAYAKSRGKANARVLFSGQAHEHQFRWWLLVSEGVGVVHKTESLRDARDKRSRIRIGDDYELVRRTRPATQGGGTVWTWRMTRANYTRWRVSIIRACRRSDPQELNRVLRSLYRVPGYSGARAQVGRLVETSRQEWRRRHGSLAGVLWPLKLGYVERIKDTSIALTTLMDDWEPEMNGIKYE